MSGEKVPSIIPTSNNSAFEKQKESYIDAASVSPEYITTLEGDEDLFNFVKDSRLLFEDGEDFYKGATFAHLIITTMQGVDLPDKVSNETIEDFQNDVDEYYNRRELLGLNTEWYVKNPRSKNPEIYKKERDIGEVMLKPHLFYNSQEYSDLVEFFRGFENPEFKLGAFTVFTLKELEAQRIEEEKAPQEPASPVVLVPKKSFLIKSA